MSFWKKLFRRRESAPEVEDPARTEPTAARTEPSAKAPAGDEDDELSLLRRLEQPGGADASEALATLRRHQGMSSQSRVIAAVLEGLEGAGGGAARPAGDRQRPPGVDARLDALRVACAHLLEERGQRDRAMALIEKARSVDAMMLAADLHAAHGNLARALSAVERVLARDIDAPGARERHERWSAQLGRVSPRAHVVDDGATVVAPETSGKLDLRLLREVARGGAGTVYEAEDELLGRRVAFKLYHRADQLRGQIEREARTAVMLRGPGVVRVFDADPVEGWLVLEWLPRGSLRDLLTNAIDDVVTMSRWIPPLLEALERVHAADLIHADIKPANVLFRSLGEPLLSDFGSCRHRGEANAGGTPGYLAPERLDGAAADPRDDVYAVGRLIEDVLAAREDATLPDAVMRASEDDARLWAQVAMACLAEAPERPANATELRAFVVDILRTASTGDVEQDTPHLVKDD